MYTYIEGAYMGSTGVYFRVNRELLERFTKLAESLGMSRSEAIRKAMEMFIERYERKDRETMTSKMRGIVRSKLSLRELEEAYMVLRT